MIQENTKLCDFSNTNNNDFIGTPLAPPATSAENCDINTVLLNLVMEVLKKDVDNDVVKMKLFPFSLHDSTKIWFSSFPQNSIDSWNKCKDAFITKYFPPAKNISLRTHIMNFKQLEHEHVA